MYLLNKGAFKEALCSTYLSGPSVTVLENSAIPYYLFDISRSIWTQTFLTIHLEHNSASDNVPSAFARRCQAGHKIYAPVMEANKALLREHGIKHAAGIILNSLHEEEVERLSDTAAFPEMSHKIIYRVGPLVPESAGDQSIPNTVQAWMNQQNGKPVVYVAFGSMAVPAPEQIAEIADALINLKVTNCILQLSLSVCEAHP